MPYINYEMTSGGTWGAGHNDGSIHVGKLSTGTYVSELRVISDSTVKNARITVGIKLGGDCRPYDCLAYISSTQYTPNNVIANASGGVRATYGGETIPTGYVSRNGVGESSTIYYTLSLSTMNANTSYYIYLYDSSSGSGSIDGSETTSNYSISYTYTVQYTITYKHENGTDYDTDTVDEGSSYTIRSSGPSKSSSSSKVTVTFDGNGGTPSKNTETATNTTSYSLSSWYSGSTTYAKGSSITITGNLTLYPSYSSSVSHGSLTAATATKPSTSNTRTVTLNASNNGGSCSTSSLSSTKTDTYSCNGWYTAKSGGTKMASSGGSMTPGTTQTVYAQWTTTAGSYSGVTLPSASKSNSSTSRTVTLNANKGTVSTTTLTSTATITYTHTGWYTSASGGTKRNSGYTPSASETLYAQFSNSVGNYSAVSLPTPTRNGYKFLGWATSSTAESGTTGSYTPSNNVTLYAIWEPLATIFSKVNDDWKPGQPYVKVDGEWKKGIAFYVKVNGEWKLSNR